MGQLSKKFLRRLNKNKAAEKKRSEEEIEVAKQTHRIIKNVETLLKQGLFAGVAAEAIFESQQWIAGMLAEAEAMLPKPEKKDEKKNEAQAPKTIQ